MQTQSTAMPADVSGNHEAHDTASVQALGFWIYLMSDLVMFSGLFATYIVMAHNYAGGPTGKELFNLTDALLETMLLLFSSVAFGLGMVGMHKGNKGMLLAGLAAALLLGAGFVGMEAAEFHHMIGQGAGPQRSGFLSAFFTLVGTHGLHVSFGILWMLVMMAQIATKGLTGPVQARLVRLGMFWHFLDIVWICLFSVVYLMGVIS
ncbi:MAG: cytochrome o ubiquinol oxidase subunit III [Acidobacteriota bacterium]